MEEAISNSIKELSIIIEPEPKLSQVTEEIVVTDNNTENDTAEKEHFGPLIVICKDLTQEKERKINSSSSSEIIALEESEEGSIELDFTCRNYNSDMEVGAIDFSPEQGSEPSTTESNQNRSSMDNSTQTTIPIEAEKEEPLGNSLPSGIDYTKLTRCQLIDTILGHRAELTEQFIFLINALAHGEYDDQYSVWRDEILDVVYQLIRIDTNWRLKVVTKDCGHIIIRHEECTCDEPFHYKTKIERRRVSRPRKRVLPTIPQLIEKRDSNVRDLLFMINESVVDYDYPRDNITWVMELRRIIQRILDIDPSWKLECIRVPAQCMKIKREQCNC